MSEIPFWSAYQNTLTSAAVAALKKASFMAEAENDLYIGTEHVLYGLLHASAEGDGGTPCIASTLLATRGITAQKTEHLFKEAREHDMQIDAAVILPSFQRLPTPAVERILKRAVQTARRFSFANEEENAAVEIGTEHLLYALLCESDSGAAHIITAQNVPLHELYGDVLSFLTALSAESAIFAPIEEEGSHAAHKERTGESTTTEGEGKKRDPLTTFGVDLCAKAKTLDPIVGRDREIEDVLRILLRRRKNNPCLLGEAGVGKTAIVEGIAARMANGTVPKELLGCRIISVDMGAMLAGSKYRGEFEGRMRDLLEACEAHPEVILFLDELHTMMGAGAAEGALDASNLLKPALARGTLRLIGATTHAEYRRYIAKDAAMERRFQPVPIEEPSREATFEMLRALRPSYEVHHGVLLPDETLRAAITYSVYALPTRYLPAKAIDCIDEAAATKRMQVGYEKNKKELQYMRDIAILSGNNEQAWKAEHALHAPNVAPPTVTKDDIAAVLSARTGMPILTKEEEGERLRTMEEELFRSIIGQEEAISHLCATMRHRYTDIYMGTRPRASFLLSGGMGVGKTATANALAHALYHAAPIAYDLSEYTGHDAVYRLLGMPHGYTGTEEESSLCKTVRHRPHSLLYFMHAEKAHPDVCSLLSQIAKTGKLTDNRGATADFSHTVLLVCANTDTAHTAHPLGFTSDKENHAAHALSSMFSPTFIANFDAVIHFRTLDLHALSAIAQKELLHACKRLEEAYSIKITPSKAFVSAFCTFDTLPKEGAHAVAERISAHVQKPLADALLSQKVRAGEHAKLIWRAKENKADLVVSGEKAPVLL